MGCDMGNMMEAILSDLHDDDATLLRLGADALFLWEGEYLVIHINDSLLGTRLVNATIEVKQWGGWMAFTTLLNKHNWSYYSKHNPNTPRLRQQQYSLVGRNDR